MSSVPVTLQISLAPSDWRHARELLLHQVRAWRGQVAEILLTIDYHKSQGRFSARWEEGKERIGELAASIEGARVVSVDYSDEAIRRVETEFFDGKHVPAKDFRGGPCYSYFYGLSEARGRYVLHTDSDIFFGGFSQQWIEEALTVFKTHTDVLFLAPLSGPPHASGRIKTLEATPDSQQPWGQRFNFMSTRLFLLDRCRFRERINCFHPTRPKLRSMIKALVEKNPAWDLPEHWLTMAMRNAGMYRYEFLGTGSGMWSLHPPYRCEAFFAKIPELIHQVESGELPLSQLGCHDFNQSMVDWSEAIDDLKENRWWRRIKPFGN